MKTTILSRQASGICDITGKSDTEVFLLQANGGAPMAVSTARLLEILRWNCAVGDRPQEPPANNSIDSKPSRS